MKLVSYNIQYGFGGDGRYDLARCGQRRRRRRHHRACRRSSGTGSAATRTTSRNCCPGCCPTITGSMARPSTWTPASSGTAASDQPPPAVRHHGAVEAADRLVAAASRCRCAARCGRSTRSNAALECMIRTPAGPVRVFSLHLAAYRAPRSGWSRSTILLAEHRRAPSEGGPWSGVDDEPARNWTQRRGGAGKPAGGDLDGRFQHGAGQRRIPRASSAARPIIAVPPISTVSSMPLRSPASRRPISTPM